MSDTPSSSEPLRSQRFLFEARLGEGGMGAVYEAVDRERQVRVAVKTLRQLGPEQVLRFKGEFRKLQGLHHPNLVTLGELVEEQGQWFLTMELVKGEDFLRYVRPRGAPPPPTGSQTHHASEGATVPVSGRPGTSEATQPLSLPPLSGIAPPAAQAPAIPLPSPGFDEGRLRLALAQLALGLNALHRAGKVHRDIKPSNILVTPEGRLRLLDFGILTDMEEVVPEGTIYGTAAYMAPEQARGARPSPEMDWYAVGVLLYEALTGQRPFTGSPQAILEAKGQVEPVPPQELVAGLPEGLCRLCVELLRMDMRQRCTGEEVLRRLGLEAVARQEAWATTAMPFVGRQRELRVLHEALAQARAGASRVVRVEGESGVGKSRLVRRFLEEVTWQQGEAVVLSGRCYERESLPYKGVDGLVDALAGYLGGPGRQEAAELLPEGAAELCQLFPVLASVVPRLAAPGQVEPVQVRVSAFAALRELLGRLARRRPLVLVVDDIQWADRDSLGLLEEVLAEPGLLLVATVRSGPSEPTLAQQQGRVWQEARVVELSGLLPDQSEALIRRLLLRRSKLPEEEVWRIVRESGGHPLFIDALVHQPREPGAQEQALSLEQVLWARMGLLEPAVRGVLALLAVAEGPLSHEVARQAAALEAAEYVRAMASLRGARLAVSSGPAASATLEVLHDKVRQAVLLHLEPPERRAWHLRLATTLETQPRPPAESLARHWREVGNLERAAQYYLQAAREAEQVLAFSRAAQLYQVLLELQPWEPQERSRLLVARGEALACAGHGAEAALALLAAAEHSPHAQALRLRAGSQYLLVGHFEQGMALVRQTLARQGLALARSPATALLSLLWQRLWIRPPSRLELREASQVPAHTLERLELLDSLQQGLTPVSPLQGAVFQASYVRLALRTRERHHLLRALGHEVLFAATLDSRQRLARWSELLEQVEAHVGVEPSDRAYTAVVRTLCAAILGECRRAQRGLEVARELLRHCTGLYRERCMLSGFGFWCLGMAGELAELRREAALVLAEARERGDLYTYVALSLYAAPLRRLSEGEVAGMRREVDELLAQCRLTGFSTQHVHHLKAHALADLYEGEPEAAVRRLEEAWPQVRRAGMLWAKASSAELLDLRSRVLLSAAQARGAERDARVLERLGQPYTVACAELVRAGLSALRGEPEAAARYGSAARRLEEEGMLLYAASARVRQGELLGGEQGEALVRQTCEWMRQRGILHPERVAAMYAPPTARRV